MTVDPLFVTRLILNRRTDTLVAVTVVFLPFRHKSLLRVWKSGVCRTESFLSRNSAASSRRCDHVTVLAYADGDVTNVQCDLATLGVTQCLG